MSSQLSARRDRVSGEARSRADWIERRLARFPAPGAASVRALAAEHPALADLALSFPAALFALAAPGQGRGRAAALAGRPLRAIAAEAGVPMWTRALPPEAFARPLGRLPDSPLFNRRIANHMPRSPKRAADWLKRVEDAARWGDEAIAVWIAQEFEREPRKVEAARLPLVCLWAWFSQRPDALAATLCRKPWTPRMRFATALAEARDWLASVELTCAVGRDDYADSWLQPAVIGDLAFAPLTSAKDVIDEARRMRNCLRTYGSALWARRSRLWSVRRGAEHLATVEIGARGGAVVTLRQAASRDNRPLDPEVERAIHEWMRSQPLQQAPPLNKGAHPLDRSVWVALWRPYWLAKRRLPDGLPLSPSLLALHQLGWGKHLG